MTKSSRHTCFHCKTKRDSWRMKFNPITKHWFCGPYQKYKHQHRNCYELAKVDAIKSTELYLEQLRNS